jgi:hypothetical protein
MVDRLAEFLGQCIMMSCRNQAPYLRLGYDELSADVCSLTATLAALQLPSPALMKVAFRSRAQATHFAWSPPMPSHASHCSTGWPPVDQDRT